VVSHEVEVGQDRVLQSVRATREELIVSEMCEYGSFPDEWAF